MHERKKTVTHQLKYEYFTLTLMWATWTIGHAEIKNYKYELFPRALCSFTMAGQTWSLHSHCLLLIRLLGSNLYIQVPSTVFWYPRYVTY